MIQGFLPKRLSINCAHIMGDSSVYFNKTNCNLKVHVFDWVLNSSHLIYYTSSSEMTMHDVNK